MGRLILFITLAILAFVLGVVVWSALGTVPRILSGLLDIFF